MSSPHSEREDIKRLKVGFVGEERLIMKRLPSRNLLLNWKATSTITQEKHNTTYTIPNDTRGEEEEMTSLLEKCRRLE